MAEYKIENVQKKNILNETVCLFVLTEIGFYQEAPVFITELLQQGIINNDYDGFHIFIDNEQYMKSIIDTMRIKNKITYHLIKDFYSILHESSSENLFIIFSSHGNPNSGISYSFLDFSPVKLYEELDSISGKRITILFTQCYAGLYKKANLSTNNKYNIIGACDISQKATMIPEFFMVLLDSIANGINVEKLLQDAGIDFNKPEFKSLITILCSIFLHVLCKNILQLTNEKLLDDEYQKYIAHFNLLICTQIVNIKKGLIPVPNIDSEIERLDSLLM